MAWKCMVMALCVIAAMVVGGDLSAEDDVQAFVDSINNKQTMWTATKRDITDMKNLLFQNQLGLDIHERALQDPTVNIREVRATNKYVPPTYDASEEYPECNIRRLKRQYKCGSCWAVASAGVMQDRLCIHSHGQIKVNISAAHLVGCCKSCAIGCSSGGTATYAFGFMMRQGIVTGGEYDSNDGCYPYPLCPTCDMPPGFSCPHNCPNRYYEKDMENDKYYVSELRLVKKGAPISAMQYELFRNGPVVVQIDVHEDFMYYTGGIYQYTEGKLLGGHYVRLIGYGSKNGVDYWIGVNSWRTWGEDGTFRIRRGVNESGIESYAITALPDLSMYK